MGKPYIKGFSLGRDIKKKLKIKITKNATSFTISFIGYERAGHFVPIAKHEQKRASPHEPNS